MQSGVMGHSTLGDLSKLDNFAVPAAFLAHCLVDTGLTHEFVMLLTAKQAYSRMCVIKKSIYSFPFKLDRDAIYFVALARKLIQQTLDAWASELRINAKFDVGVLEKFFPFVSQLFDSFVQLTTRSKRRPVFIIV
jgi:hypothetical protein